MDEEKNREVKWNFLLFILNVFHVRFPAAETCLCLVSFPRSNMWLWPEYPECWSDEFYSFHWFLAEMLFVWIFGLFCFLWLWFHSYDLSLNGNGDSGLGRVFRASAQQLPRSYLLKCLRDAAGGISEAALSNITPTVLLWGRRMSAFFLRVSLVWVRTQHIDM